MRKIVVMGVSGSGKNSVGKALATELNIPFIDSDDLHSDANKQKMASGSPLTDEDRWSWLDLVGAALKNHSEVVVACSALKLSYRDRIRAIAPETTFLLLHTPRSELDARIQRRQQEEGHFMPASLLDSQLETLEALSPIEKGFTLINQGPLPAVIERAVALIGWE